MPYANNKKTRKGFNLTNLVPLIVGVLLLSVRVVSYKRHQTTHQQAWSNNLWLHIFIHIRLKNTILGAASTDNSYVTSLYYIAK